MNDKSRIPKLYVSNSLDKSEGFSDGFSKMQNILQKWDDAEF